MKGDVGQSLVKSFLQRHNQLLSVIGALIVFMTFVIREGLSEYWKGFGESIENAEYFFSVHLDTSALESSLAQNYEWQFDQSLAREKETREMIVYSRKQDTTANEIPYPQRIEMRLPWTMLADEVDSTLNTTEILADKLPKQDMNRHRLEILRAAVPKYRDLIMSVKAEKTADGEIIYPTADTKLETERIAQEELKKISDMESGGHDLQAKSEKLRDDVFADARALRRENEIKSQISWWISAVLFTVGSALTILGRIYHVEVAANGE